MIRTTRKFFGLFFVAFLVLAASFVATARELPLDLTQLERLRILGPNNLPVKVLVVYNPPENGKFVVDLINLVVKIHETDGISKEDKFKVHVVTTRAEDKAELEKSLTPQIMKDFVEINDKFYTKDVWMQDWGEVATAKFKNEPKQKMIVLDSNRGRGIAALPAILANFWNCYCIKNPSTQFSAGDYGGNIEITPDDVLIIGNTSTNELRDLLSKYGYKDRMAVVETDWLAVGHCDETLSVVPNDKAPEGFTIVKANPRLALQLIRKTPRSELEQISNADYRETLLKVHDYLQKAGEDSASESKTLLSSETDNNSTIENSKGNSFGAHLVKYLDNLDEEGRPTKGHLEIARNLMRTPSNDKNAPDAKVVEFVKKNLALAVLIDSNIKTICKKIDQVNGKTDTKHSILSFPVMYHPYYGKQIAYVPGVVNQLILRKHLIIPDPQIKSFRDYIDKTAKVAGLSAHFLDDMYYHELAGEIHCGTNVFRHPNKYIVRPKNLPQEISPLH